MNGIKGKTALVTGGANGIGRAFVKRLAEEGANIVVADIANADVSIRVAQDCGVRAMAIECDMSSGEDIASMNASIEHEFGGCDILVHNAGIYPPQKFDDITFADWRKLMTVNLDSMFHLSKAVYPKMKEKGWGRIISISSTTFHSGIEMYSHYSATKAGLIGFSRGLAKEIGQFGITVNCIAPGLVKTETTESGPNAEWFDAIAEQQSIKRTETPEDLVGPMAFLASDDAAFITGQTLLVDGGWCFV